MINRINIFLDRHAKIGFPLLFAAAIFLSVVAVASATTYTVTWCPSTVPAPYLGYVYNVCVEDSAPASDACRMPVAIAWDTQHSFDAPDTANLWVRVRVVGYTSFSPMRWVNGAWSNPVQIVAGLTPPAIGGCP